MSCPFLVLGTAVSDGKFVYLGCAFTLSESVRSVRVMAAVFRIGWCMFFGRRREGERMKYDFFNH